MELARNADVAEKVYAEVVGVCGEGPITWEHVHEMPFVVVVIIVAVVLVIVAVVVAVVIVVVVVVEVVVVVW